MKKFALIVALLCVCFGMFADDVCAARGDVASWRAKRTTDTVRILKNTGHLVPGTDSAVDLGSSALKFRELNVDFINSVAMSGAYQLTTAIVVPTTYSVTLVQSGTTFMNPGASASAVYQLPTPTTGVSFVFSDVSTVAGGDIYISAPANVTINKYSTATVIIHKNVEDSNPDVMMELYGTSATAYIFRIKRGNWTTDTAYIH